MKWLLVTLCGFFLASSFLVNGSPIANAEQQQGKRLLGAKECTWGPSYWCHNITNAKNCNAVSHCIQTVWEKHAVPEDNDSICKICLDMVEEARDQLRSNMTQDDLKAVFEGSCELIPLKIVSKQCIKMVDNFVPELIETLSSQMNPQVVCSVAGLCNNAAIDQMLLEEAAARTTSEISTTKSSPSVDAPFTCNKCKSIAGIIAQKFHSADRDDVLELMLRQCGKMSSFSDACANIVLVYFNEIYDHLKATLNSDNVCHMSGACALQYHQHEDDEEQQFDDDVITAEQLRLEIRPMSDVGVVSVQDDIPCELCKQLVHHLKDLLIANTTQLEFKTVLEGLCNQTMSFRAECTSIVDQYYIKIYDTLVSDLNENEACCLIEICPRGLADQAELDGPIAPLLPILEPAHLNVRISAKPRLQHKKYLGEGEPEWSSVDISRAQLPFDTLLGAQNADRLIEGGRFCLICEYAAHFVQTTLADTKNEAEIKAYMKKMCGEVSAKLRGECDAFVDNYGDAFIALFIQQIDPSQICPRMFVCSAPRNKDVEVLPQLAGEGDDEGGIQINHRQKSGTEKCPMCLFAVAQAQAAIKSDKSKSNIIFVLDRLCNPLPKKMQIECQDFVETYTKELVNMLVDDFSPDRICVELSLCDPKKSTKPEYLELATGGDIETNEIPDITFNGELISTILVDNEVSPNCLLCEELVKEIEKRASNKKSREQLKEALEHACEKMHKLQNKCTQIVDKYGDRIVDLILAEVTPKQICRELGMCILRMEVEMDSNRDVVVTATKTIARPLSQSQIIDDLFMPNTDVKVFDANFAYARAGDSTLCVICQTVMEQLEAELKDKSTQKEIEDTIKNICHSFPKSFDTQCTNFIDSYATLIISLIDTTPPKQICAQLNLCATPSVVESKLEVLECAVCHASAQTLAHVLEDPKVEKNIEQLMDKTCTRLPGAYYDRCLRLMQVYGHSMVNIITGRGELQSVCTLIGMCYPDEYVSFAQLSDS